jgi:3-oxoacyl-[acyl-carrier protein] reductase
VSPALGICEARGAVSGHHDRRKERHDPLVVNLTGAFYMARAVLRPMLKARGGRIINMSSVSGQAVAPGFVVTELTDGLPDNVKDAIKAATPLGRFASTDDIAAAVLFLASDEAGYITGQVPGIDGGLAMM